ncbi:hypothetical protein CPB86DRAFT_389473 [Serendipita vermifera]|nr:hypothetical protein CPB86DRAFT_389473 [Serendipita vermifera]
MRSCCGEHTTPWLRLLYELPSMAWRMRYLRELGALRSRTERTEKFWNVLFDASRLYKRRNGGGQQVVHAPLSIPSALLRSPRPFPFKYSAGSEEGSNFSRMHGLSAQTWSWWRGLEVARCICHDGRSCEGPYETVYDSFVVVTIRGRDGCLFLGDGTLMHPVLVLAEDQGLAMLAAT